MCLNRITRVALTSSHSPQADISPKSIGIKVTLIDKQAVKMFPRCCLPVVVEARERYVNIEDPARLGGISYCSGSGSQDLTPASEREREQREQSHSVSAGNILP